MGPHSEERKKIFSKVLRLVAQANKDYGMLKLGDRIVVAVSGGKDSLTTLHQLTHLRDSGLTIELYACHIKTDMRCAGCMHTTTLESICQKWKVEFSEIFFPIRQASQHRYDCFYCAMRRRAALFQFCTELGANKLAFGHHLDDIVETLLMNILYQANISTMSPVRPLFGGRLVVIRPLAYVQETLTKEYAKKHEFPTQLCRCPGAMLSVRLRVKNLLREVETLNQNAKTNLMALLRNGKPIPLTPA